MLFRAQCFVWNEQTARRAIPIKQSLPAKGLGRTYELDQDRALRRGRRRCAQINIRLGFGFRLRLGRRRFLFFDDRSVAFLFLRSRIHSRLFLFASRQQAGADQDAN